MLGFLHPLALDLQRNKDVCSSCQGLSSVTTKRSTDHKEGCMLHLLWMAVSV